MTAVLPVVVAGAGIAGLATALALARRGVAVEVIERAPAITEIGAGLQLSPNAVHALDRLGVRAAVAAAAVAPDAVHIASAPRGRRLASVPLGGRVAARHGAPYFVVARGDLLAALHEAAAASPLIRLTLATAVRGVAETAGGVTVETSAGRLSAGVLVGADGVRSAVRAAIGGAAATPTGKVAFRATAPLAAAPPTGGARDAGTGFRREELRRDTWVWLSPNAHLVHYPLRRGDRLNLVAVVAATAAERDADGWDHAAATDAVLARFAGFPADVRTLLAAGEDWRRWPLIGVDPAGRWHRGRTVLVGDAAHAMLPFLAQGAAMAIEDAVVLADTLAGGTDAAAAIAAWVGARRDRVRRVAAAAARNGEIYHQSGVVAAARDLTLSMTPAGLLLSGLDWLYGWRPTAA